MKRLQMAPKSEVYYALIDFDKMALRIVELLEERGGIKLSTNSNQVNNVNKDNYLNEVDRMNQKEAAKFIGVCEVTMCKYKKAGLVPHHTIPGTHKITYYKSELREFMYKRPDLLGVARK